MPINRSIAQPRWSTELNEAGHEAAAFGAELRDEDATRAMIDRARRHFGRLDLLVNNAATWSPTPLDTVAADDLRRFFEINTVSTFVCCQQAGLHHGRAGHRRRDREHRRLGDGPPVPRLQRVLRLEGRDPDDDPHVRRRARAESPRQRGAARARCCCRRNCPKRVRERAVKGTLVAARRPTGKCRPGRAVLGGKRLRDGRLPAGRRRTDDRRNGLNSDPLRSDSSLSCRPASQAALQNQANSSGLAARVACFDRFERHNTEVQEQAGSSNFCLRTDSNAAGISDKKASLHAERRAGQCASLAAIDSGDERRLLHYTIKEMAMSISRSSFRPWTLFLASRTGLRLHRLAVAAEPRELGRCRCGVSDVRRLGRRRFQSARRRRRRAARHSSRRSPILKQQFTSDEELQKYLDGVSKAIGEASDKILAGEATDRQLIDAIEWKIESLRIRQKLGDEIADKQTDEFLAGLKFDGRPTVDRRRVEEIRQNRAAMQQQMELMTKLHQWPRLDDAAAGEDHRLADQLDQVRHADRCSRQHAHDVRRHALRYAGQRAGEEGTRRVAARPQPERQSRRPGPAAAARRHQPPARICPAIKLELSGKFLDGNELDWASYRGKVVLVDYWATWCGPCRAEVPNVLENYLKYHDKGFDVIGISLDDKRSDAEDYVKQTNIPWPSLFHDVDGRSAAGRIRWP